MCMSMCRHISSIDLKGNPIPHMQWEKMRPSHSENRAKSLGSEEVLRLVFDLQIPFCLSQLLELRLLFFV